MATNEITNAVRKHCFTASDYPFIQTVNPELTLSLKTNPNPNPTHSCIFAELTHGICSFLTYDMVDLRPILSLQIHLVIIVFNKFSYKLNAVVCKMRTPAPINENLSTTSLCRTLTCNNATDLTVDSCYDKSSIYYATDYFVFNRSIHK